jgi:hypothetical protein
MLLRILAWGLAVANCLFYAWSHDHLKSWGLAQSSQNETHRLTEQIEPERILVRQASKDAPPSASQISTVSEALPAHAPAASNAITAAAMPTNCLMAGVFNDKQSSALKQAIDAKLPNLGWRFDTSTAPARWIVYMGKYANNDQRDLKKKQLDQIKVRYEVLTESNLEPGLSLGSHASQAVANQALQQLIKQGVRTARVLQEAPEQKGQLLIVPAIDDATRTKLNAVYANLASQLANKPLQACKS